MRAFVQGKIDAHRETFDEKNIRDFVDVYLESEKNEKKDHASEVYSGNNYGLHQADLSVWVCLFLCLCLQNSKRKSQLYFCGN